MTEKHNIENDNDDLNGAPNLSKLGGGNPFKIRNDYFENFADKLLHHIDELEEIKAEAPLLISIPKNNPFEVPIDYFDELPTIIQQRCIDDKPSISIKAWLLLLIKPRFAVPVFATVLIAFSGINFMDKNAELQKINEESISINEHLYNIDETTIIEALTSEANVFKKNDTNEPIENYLIDNNIDEYNLSNEL